MPNVNAETPFGLTPTHAAANQGKAHMVEFLTSVGGEMFPQPMLLWYLL